MDKSVRDAGGRKDGALRRQILRKRERRDGQKESFLFAPRPWLILLISGDEMSFRASQIEFPEGYLPTSTYFWR